VCLCVCVRMHSAHDSSSTTSRSLKTANGKTAVAGEAYKNRTDDDDVDGWTSRGRRRP